jgi:hypothetical protein
MKGAGSERMTMTASSTIRRQPRVQALAETLLKCIRQTLESDAPPA